MSRSAKPVLCSACQSDVESISYWYKGKVYCQRCFQAALLVGSPVEKPFVILQMYGEIAHGEVE